MQTIDAKVNQARTNAATATATPTDAARLRAATSAVQVAGARMLGRFDPHPRTPAERDDVVRAIHANDVASLDVVRELLERAHPGAGWVDDELEGGPLPGGDFWLVDPVEGNINHVHGLREWGVSATLVRDNVPVLAAVYEPVADRTYTALRGSGVALVGDRPMHPSAKTTLAAAIVSTGQAKPGETPQTFARTAKAVEAMLHAALVVRMTVPATFQLTNVAAGHIDAFWQFSDVRSGLAAGALFVSEAGGLVTDVVGEPWTLASESFLAAAPGVHAEALQILRGIL